MITIIYLLILAGLRTYGLEEVGSKMTDDNFRKVATEASLNLFIDEFVILDPPDEISMNLRYEMKSSGHLVVVYILKS